MTMNIKAYCKTKWPEEACGVMVGDAFLPCDNLASDPQNTFELSPDVFIRHEVQAVVHSHPEDEPFLSPHDRKSQVATGLPWWLVTQGKIKRFPCVPLLRGRTFDYGVHDCGTLVEDAFALCGIKMRRFRRGDLDGDEAINKLEVSLPKCGFERLGADDALQAGDVLMASAGRNGNHLMFYLGDEQVLHHVYDRLSRIEMYGQKMQVRTHSIWRHKKWRPEMIEAIQNDLKAYDL